MAPRVFLAGPAFTAAERVQLDRTARVLEHAGYQAWNPARDGFTLPALAWLQAPPGHGPEHPGPPGNAARARRAVRLGVSARAISALARECDALVLNMNGRVPDPGATFLAGVAFARGLPVVLYKQDHRSAFHGQDNSMITGLSPLRRPVDRLSRVPSALDRAREKLGTGKRASARVSKSLEPTEPLFLRQVAELGLELASALELSESGKNLTRDAPETNTGRPPPALAPDGVSTTTRVVDAFVADTGLGDLWHWNADTTRARPETLPRRVYCSGPLFDPAEMRAMCAIATVLERHSASTYLPQRDGVEAFVMNAANAPASTAWLARPVTRWVDKQIFALDVHEIVEGCDALVFNATGAAPDEGGVVEAGIAFGTGKPVVAFHDGLRVSRATSLPPVMSWASFGLRPVASLADLPGVLAHVVSWAARVGTGPLPPSHHSSPIHAASIHGRKVKRWLRKFRFARPRSRLQRI